MADYDLKYSSLFFRMIWVSFIYLDGKIFSNLSASRFRKSNMHYILRIHVKLCLTIIWTRIQLSKDKHPDHFLLDLLKAHIYCNLQVKKFPKILHPWHDQIQKSRKKNNRPTLGMIWGHLGVIFGRFWHVFEDLWKVEKHTLNYENIGLKMHQNDLKTHEPYI